MRAVSISLKAEEVSCCYLTNPWAFREPICRAIAAKLGRPWEPIYGNFHALEIFQHGAGIPRLVARFEGQTYDILPDATVAAPKPEPKPAAVASTVTPAAPVEPPKPAARTKPADARQTVIEAYKSRCRGPLRTARETVEAYEADCRGLPIATPEQPLQAKAAKVATPPAEVTRNLHAICVLARPEQPEETPDQKKVRLYIAGCRRGAGA